MRLKANHIKTIEFQFQSGAVKRTHKKKMTQNILMFQFQSGAVKRPLQKIHHPNPNRFNSKVVRLKVRKHRDDNKALTVSIPKWCG